MELKMLYVSQVTYIVYKYFLILITLFYPIKCTSLLKPVSNQIMCRYTKLKQTKKCEWEIYILSIYFFSQNSILWHLFQLEQ